MSKDVTTESDAHERQARGRGGAQERTRAPSTAFPVAADQDGDLDEELDDDWDDFDDEFDDDFDDALDKELDRELMEKFADDGFPGREDPDEGAAVDKGDVDVDAEPEEPDEDLEGAGEEGLDDED